jgi:dCMP deaminase
MIEVRYNTVADKFTLIRNYAESHSPVVDGRKTGCMLQTNDHTILACNDFPSGVQRTEERAKKGQRHIFLEHAERAAIYAAAKQGIPTKGAEMYLPWFPCADCARAIVEVGIGTIYAMEPDWNETNYSFRESFEILREGGVRVAFVKQAMVPVAPNVWKSGGIIE